MPITQATISPTPQQLVNEFLLHVRDARVALERVIEAKAWLHLGHQTFTDWWRADLEPREHVTKEVAFTAAMQMIREGQELFAIDYVYGIADYVVMNLKVADKLGLAAWTLAHNSLQETKRGQHRLVLEASDDNTITDYKVACSRASTNHKVFALGLITGATAALAAGASPADVLGAINDLSGTNVAGPAGPAGSGSPIAPLAGPAEAEKTPA